MQRSHEWLFACLLNELWNFLKTHGTVYQKKLTLCKFFKLSFSFGLIILALILSLLGAFEQDASFFDSLFSQTLCYGLSWNSFSSSAVKWLKVKHMMSLFSIGFWTPHQKVTQQFMSYRLVLWGFSFCIPPWKSDCSRA